MGNSYFQFKQFAVHQDKTAMKVCTDTCLFGAYMAQNFSRENVLDIGAGTGLLSLMYVQKNHQSNITAIEIEENAFAQAQENILQSPWKARIGLRHIALQQYSPTEKFDLILCNPPFFDNDLKSADAERNMAMHSTQLSLSEIFAFAAKYLNENGTFALLLPYHRTAESENIAATFSFFLQEKLLVRQTPKHDFFRSILVFSTAEKSILEKEMTIKDAENQYSAAFAELLKDYYLFL